MSSNSEGAGAVIMATDYNALKTWVKQSIDDQAPMPHGEQYSQQFIAMQVSKRCSVCFYVINGYETHSENIAFERAEFMMDEFLECLDDYAPESPHMAFADVGNALTKEDLIGFGSLEKGLSAFKLDYKDLLNLRAEVIQKGEVLWKN